MPDAASIRVGKSQGGDVVEQPLHYYITHIIGARRCFFSNILNIMFSDKPADIPEWVAMFYKIREGYAKFYGLNLQQELAEPTVILPIQRGSFGLMQSFKEIAETVIPEVASWGYKRIVLSVSNYDALFYPPGIINLGGEAGLKYLINKAHENNIKVIAWTASHRYDYAPETQILREHPEWLARCYLGLRQQKPPPTEYSSWLSFLTGFVNTVIRS